MPDELTDEERELLAKHRAERAKSSRKVKVRGKHDSGAEYEFDLEGDEAERVIARHKSLFEEKAEPEKPETPPARKGPYFKGKEATA